MGARRARRLRLGHDRDHALTALLTQTARVREWLHAHGAEIGLPPLGRVEIAGETPVRIEPDGYEINATLDVDQRPVGVPELERAARRLGWLREDLLALADRIETFEATAGSLPADSESGERTAEDVLRHMAGTEVWLVARLDPGLRYQGPMTEAPVRDQLAATCAWALDTLGARAARDDGTEVADRHGETWTVGKVVRHLQYHAFDHLWELDRRLARADGTGERVEVRLDRRPDDGAMAALLRSVGWDGRTADIGALGRAIEGTPEFAAAWDGDLLVGTARSLTDGAMYAHIATVVVRPRYQGLGVGERLMRILMDGRDGVRFAPPGMDAWYRRLGYVDDERAMVRRRTHP